MHAVVYGCRCLILCALCSPSGRGEGVAGAGERAGVDAGGGAGAARAAAGEAAGADAGAGADADSLALQLSTLFACNVLKRVQLAGRLYRGQLSWGRHAVL